MDHSHSNTISPDLIFGAAKLRNRFKIERESLEAMQNKLMQAEYAANSIAAMEQSLKAFARYCAAFEQIAFPASAEALKEFITWGVMVRHYRLETVSLVLWAVALQHRQAGLASPVDASVKALFSNCRRAVKEPRLAKRALTVEQLRRCLNGLNTGDPIDMRDRGLIGLGFASALRRSELTALFLSDVTFNGKGLLLAIRSSKTDQIADGQYLAIPYGDDPHTCPVRALKGWLAVRGDWAGPVFTRFTLHRRPQATHEPIGGQTICRALKHALERTGVASEDYGAHSMRAGMATAAAENGASLLSIQMRTRHRRAESVLRYVRPAQAFQGNPLAGVL